ncbi:hypothetical protein LSAT2_012362, partial [Lamellibrachia satsuma]
SVVYTKNGDKCVLPFKAFGKTFNSCTTDYVTVMEPWCSLTYDYDKDRKMGYCDFDKTVVYTKSGDKCAFPFKAFGKTFNSCTTDYVTVKKPWCSLTYDYDKDRRMGYCDFDKTG